MPDGTPVDLEKMYSVATIEMVALGKEGFDAFLDPNVKDVSGSLDDENEIVAVDFMLGKFLTNF